MSVRVLTGDCRAMLPTLPGQSVHCCVTSPPYYGLRDYGIDGQIGLEPTVDAYVETLVGVFREVRRVLRDDGTLWLNLGDSYANDGKWGGSSGGKHVMDGQTGGEGYRLKRHTGLKPKDLIGVPWLVAFALRADGWYLRSDIIWAKPAPMPEPVKDRPTRSHEYVFLLAKSVRYHYDADAIAEPAISDHDSGNGYDRPEQVSKGGRGQREGWVRDGNPTRNKRSVWTINSGMFPDAHFATFPPALVEPCIKAGCPEGGTVLDPFAGACTTGLVADRLGRDALLIELNPAYSRMGGDRVTNDAPLFARVEVA